MWSAQAIAATAEFLHLKFCVSIAENIVVVEDAIDIYLTTYTQLQIPVYAMLVKIEINIMLVDTVSIAWLEIKRGEDLLLTLMLSVLYSSIRIILQSHLKLQETRMKQ